MRDQDVHKLLNDGGFSWAGSADWWNADLDLILCDAVADGWPGNGVRLHDLPGWKAAFPDRFVAWILNYDSFSNSVWRREDVHIDGSRGPAYVSRKPGGGGTSYGVDEVFDKGSYGGLRRYEVAALTRATHLGLLSRPVQSACAMCGVLGFDDEKVGSHFCQECWAYTPNPRMGKRAILEFARDLAEFTGTVPSLWGWVLPKGFESLDLDTKITVLKLWKRQPTIQRVREAYGSWLAVLIKSGVLPDGAQKMSRGIRSIAKDGHVCYSLPEKVICDFLSEHGIEHTREPGYPDSNMRADFLVGDVFIEYFGLAGNAEYDAKTKMKRELACGPSLNSPGVGVT